MRVGKGLAGETAQQLRAGPGFGSQNSHSGLQLSVTTIPGDLTFSPGLLTRKQTLRHFFFKLERNLFRRKGSVGTERRRE